MCERTSYVAVLVSRDEIINNLRTFPSHTFNIDAATCLLFSYGSKVFN